MMIRSWEQRIFGGICGGLGENTRLNASLWRALFIVLTVLTGGAMVAVYVAWWWLLPQNSPHKRPPRPGLAGVFALLMLVLVLGGFLVRDSLLSGARGSLYVPLISLALALALLYRQFGVGRDVRRAPFLALGLVVVAGVPLVYGLGLVPDGLWDTLSRTAPALLIFGGVYLLLRDRLSLPAGLVALGVTALVTAGVATIAFNQRAGQFLESTTLTHTETIAPEVTLLLIDVETLDTDVAFFSGAPDERLVNVTFIGGDTHTITTTYNQGDDGIANLRLQEGRTTPHITLEGTGRARLQVEIPPDIAVALAYAGERATATFDMSALNLERLNVDLQAGDALVTLPVYQPLSPSIAQDPGRIRLAEGDLRLVVPDAIGGRFVLNRDRNLRPQFDDGRYLLIDDGADGTLQATGYENATIQIRYTLIVPRGQIRLDSAGDEAINP